MIDYLFERIYALLKLPGALPVLALALLIFGVPRTLKSSRPRLYCAVRHYQRACHSIHLASSFTPADLARAACSGSAPSVRSSRGAHFSPAGALSHRHHHDGDRARVLFAAAGVRPIFCREREFPDAAGAFGIVRFGVRAHRRNGIH